jgi:hypothetical protein
VAILGRGAAGAIRRLAAETSTFGQTGRAGQVFRRFAAEHARESASTSTKPLIKHCLSSFIGLEAALSEEHSRSQ